VAIGSFYQLLLCRINRARECDLPVRRMKSRSPGDGTGVIATSGDLRSASALFEQGLQGTTICITGGFRKSRDTINE
jgi:hypothetical protein